MIEAARPLEFGFGIFPFSRFGSIPEAVEVVRLGEELGFYAVGLPEHLLPPAWPEADLSTKLWYDLPVLAAYFAAVTTRLRFLTTVLVAPYHHPVALAKALATLDVLSQGRVMCGVGAGWMKAEFRRLGIPFAERGAITDEYLRAMKELWTSDAPAFRGNYVSFEDVSFLPKPVQQPHIPLLIGGTGPRPFQRAAELGDGWLPMTATPEGIARGAAEIRRRMAVLGRDPAALWIGYTGVSLGPDPEVAQMRRHVVTGDRQAAADYSQAGVIKQIEGYRSAGVNFVSIGVPWRNAAELMQGLRFFAREIMPAFREAP